MSDMALEETTATISEKKHEEHGSIRPSRLTDKKGTKKSDSDEEQKGTRVLNAAPSEAKTTSAFIPDNVGGIGRYGNKDLSLQLAACNKPRRKSSVTNKRKRRDQKRHQKIRNVVMMRQESARGNHRLATQTRWMPSAPEVRIDDPSGRRPTLADTPTRLSEEGCLFFTDLRDVHQDLHLRRTPASRGVLDVHLVRAIHDHRNRAARTSTRGNSTGGNLQVPPQTFSLTSGDSCGASCESSYATAVPDSTDAQWLQSGEIT